MVIGLRPTPVASLLSLIDLVARISAMSCEFGEKNYTFDPPETRETVLKWDTARRGRRKTVEDGGGEIRRRLYAE